MLTASSPCPTCDGTGYAPDRVRLDRFTGAIVAPEPPRCATCEGTGTQEMPLIEYARLSRVAAYDARFRAKRALTAAQEMGADARTLAALRAESDAVYAEYRRWVEADSAAAQSGALD